MTEIITFGNFKGGVGKTTNATQAAYELSKRGKKTLLLDLDPQANATNIMLKTKVNLTDEIFQFDSSLMSAIQSKDLTKALVNITKNLDLIGSSADFSLFPRVMERQFSKYIDRVTHLNKLLKPIAQKYDYVIIDVPPTISLITDAALYASDWCVIVMQTQQQALDGASAFIQYMQKEVIDTYHAPRLDLVGILPVLIQPGAPVDLKPKHEVSIDEIENKESNQTFNVNIKIDNTVRNSLIAISNLGIAPNQKEAVAYLVQQFRDNLDPDNQRLFDLQVDVLNKKDAKLHEK